MSPNVPSGYVPIGTLSSHVNSEVNMIGIVTDFLPPAKSRGRDCMCSFRLADCSVFDDGVKVRFFRAEETDLPRIEANGDVVILHRIKITFWNGMTIGLSSHNTNWTVIPAPSIPEKVSTGFINLKCIRGKGASGPSQELMKYAIELRNSCHVDSSAPAPIVASTDPLPSSSATGMKTGTPIGLGRRDKFALIKDLQIDKFYDLVGQVVKIYPSNGVTELYVTDYTLNNLLFSYEGGREGGDEYSNNRKWIGPYGKRTLTVSLFSPHSYYAQNNVEEHQYVFLRNVRIKYSKDAKMEGSLHTDRKNTDRVDVTILKDHSDDRVKDLLRRKLEYTKQFNDEAESFVGAGRGQKRKPQPEPRLSAKAARKKRKHQREQEAKNRRRQRAASSSSSSSNDQERENNDPYHISIKSHGGKEYTPSTSPPPASSPSIKPTTLNRNIRTTKPDVPPRPLSSILSLSTHALTTPSGIPYTLPFQNINSRAAVRIVDFLPHDIADFAVRRKQESEFDVLSDYSAPSSSSSDELFLNDTDVEAADSPAHSPTNDYSTRGESPKWEWRFALILEDASSSPVSLKSNKNTEQMTAYVTGSDAVFLLKLDACDLRRQPKRVAQLREKLFLMWGDLEERKRKSEEEGEGGARARSMPLECCVKEYGVRNRQGRKGSDDGEEADEVGDGAEENWGWDRRFRMFGTTIV
ncbi:MAG: hypothetical protein Q9220_000727 [cf. Caloplaca sp. 1 TL-2023]